MTMIDVNRTIMTGENPFIRISEKDGDAHSTDASFWRVIFSPSGPGHVLFLRSELTENQTMIYADNIALARWLQETIQGMLNADTADLSIPIIDAGFSREGDTSTYWTERVLTHDEEVSLTWYDFGEPLLHHTQPDQLPKFRYGFCTVLMPALGARLTVNGVQAKGSAWPKEREGRPFSTCALAFSESWTEPVT